MTYPLIPALVNILADDPEQAAQAPYGTQQLVLCTECGFVFNGQYEPEKTQYADGYHTERVTSGYFNSHINQVLDFIDSVEPIRGKRIFEVACGTGEFLDALSLREPAACAGVDPSATEGNYQGYYLFQAYFDRTFVHAGHGKWDLLINRHMIEHMQNPLEMLRLFQAFLPDGALLYLETPRLDWILQHQVFYDFPYEHCAYYSDDFMARLFEAAGFQIVAQLNTYGGQYHSVIARKRNNCAPVLGHSSSASNTYIKDSFCHMEQAYSKAQSYFSTFYDQEIKKGSICLWGASGKGGMCSNLIAKGKEIVLADSNPFKQGLFMPGSGHKVIASKELSAYHVRNILVENDVYLNEISALVKSIDTNINILSLSRLLHFGL